MFATSPNAKTILFPVEATQLMGTLGGIGELAKEVLRQGRQPPAPRRSSEPGVAEGQGQDDVRQSRTRLVWAIGGVILLIAEIIAPGFFLVFVGAAAIATGLFTLLFDLGTGAAAGPVRPLCRAGGDDRQALVCASRTTASSDLLLNEPAKRLVGKTVTVVDASRRPWRPGPRRRRRMECARRPCGGGRARDGDRSRRQLPDRRAGANPSPCVIEWS